MMIKFNQIISNFDVDFEINKFIFNKLSNVYTDEFNKLGFTSDDDLELFVNSFDKILTLTFEYYFNIYRESENGYDLMISKLCERIHSKFMPNWLRLAEAINSNYNPIENYSMEENENIGSNIVVDTNNDVNVFGYNTTSDDGVPNSKEKGKTTSTGDYDKNKRKLTRSGNIGVTTTQQMIESSITLARHKLLDVIFKDLNEFLFLAIYK